MEKEFTHVPVLTEEVVAALVPDGPCRIIDGTLGYGGHSSLILKKNRQAELLGIDRDGDAISSAQKVLDFASARVHLIRGEFGDLAEHAAAVGWTAVDAILLDLGISSPQIDDPRRGFSLRQDGPLDMRMDKRSPSTASRILNQAAPDELARIFWEYGDIRESRRLARAISARRAEKPLTSTLELTALCEEVLGRPRRGSGLPPATLCFQALRIAVNDELAQLERALKSAELLLKAGGRIGVISFHSLEDRIVKNFFRTAASSCLCPPGLPVCICGHKATLSIINKKPLTATQAEIAANPRSACAKLRIAEKKAAGGEKPA
ncbi:MAG: 16S rRNA (cytosine(1402)-N(4))-methyltransferase [Lentisphaerae bacterium GWF2_52_8]|nr:MAG: 16S rRNA (cytosine(1402)-N(4))-methyltransferase [Lentisphaerae bacterium GWF2_52_8]